jgi:hypothetical protein
LFFLSKSPVTLKKKKKTDMVTVTLKRKFRSTTGDGTIGGSSSL